MTQGDGKIYLVLKLEESILLKYYTRQSTDSMQSISQQLFLKGNVQNILKFIQKNKTLE